ncbi:MAG: hypothetical protein IPL83_18155 [Bdellovibrionales bacterium]|nr:hypothetical protein [Bdellovibrionales bacterium]MBK9041044.1 hypothetical protein [Bdellovibrionales bacterium]
MHIFLSLLAFSVIFSAQATRKETTKKTLISCWQDEGDQWVEVGITAENGSRLLALIVNHDDDDNSAKLNSAYEVTESADKNLYQDSSQTFRLRISRSDQSITGDLSVLKDGPGGLSLRNLTCLENDSITHQ